MLYGILLNEKQIVTTDKVRGKRIIETQKPELEGDYSYDYIWEDTGSDLVQKWQIKSSEESLSGSIVYLSKMVAATVDDATALRILPLFDEWINGHYYEKDDRVTYIGILYKCLTAHVSQEDWTPDTASSLWAKILPGQEGNEPESGYAEWVQPDSTNGYSSGDKVIYNGHLWESIVDSNVDVPGTDNGFRWKDLGVYPEQ